MREFAKTDARCVISSITRSRNSLANATFQGDISDGGVGRAILLKDPSGNLIELFEFKKK